MSIKTLLYLLLASVALASDKVQKTAIRPDEALLIFLTLQEDSATVRLELADHSGEKNGIRIIAYPLTPLGGVLDVDSIFVIGTSTTFDDSSLYTTIARQNIKKVTLKLSDFKTELKDPVYGVIPKTGFMLKVEIDKDVKSSFGSYKTPGAYLSIKGNWDSYAKNKIKP